MYKKINKKALCFSLKRGISVFLTIVIVFCLLPFSPSVNAEDDVIEISSYAELKAQSLFTTENGGNQNFEGKTLKLTANIQVPEVTDDSPENDIIYATCIFGSEENPFKGTFDGNGYTIFGLRYHEVWNEPCADTGLFVATDGAVIKNLTIESADIQSDMRGGIVVGYANNTLIDNVTVKNSSLRVSAADNVLLIGTDLGIRGGGIAGQINESVIYNCEVNNCWIRCNNTSGVAALAGKPLSLGGIVGCAEGSTIEYSRVIGTTPYDENAPSGTAAAGADTGKTYISIYYDVAVGAVGGNTLYVGGIAGRIWSNDNGDGEKGTSIIDCFSTAEMYYYCATYVSVLGVNIGHIGGITAEVWDDNCSITRCHYAGRATSYQYNALLVIPIIQHDVNVSGVANMWHGNADAARQQIYGSFFRNSINSSNEENMTTLCDRYTGEISSNGNFGPWSDTMYITRSIWENFDFDFNGTKSRTSDYDTLSGNTSGSHINRWVMDYKLGCPVHGESVAATLDFPGSGEVSIDETKLVGTKVSTNAPYTFAVQGVYSNEDSLTLEYTPYDNNYRLEGWYRIPDILDDTAPKSQDYFENLYETYVTINNVPVYGADGVQINSESVSNPVSKENTYTSVNVDNVPVQWQDNDLFIARIQTLITFYNYNNSLINKTDGIRKTATDDSDWYFYEDALPNVIPVDAPTEEGTTLIGWTTRVPSSFGSEYSYKATSLSVLQDLKNNGEFYETGDAITKPLTLYPVYVGLASNVITQFEGYMYDQNGNTVDQSILNASTRPGVGTTSYTVDLTNGAAEATVNLTVMGVNQDGSFPEGYRFLGWYEDGHCVSRDQNATITNVNLLEEHTYMARFEYAVTYNVKSGNYGAYIESEYKNGKPYTTIWHTFEEPVRQIEGLNFTNESFEHWCTDNYQGNIQVTDANVVRIPINVYSFNVINHGNNDHETTKDADLLNDFPGAGTVIIEYEEADLRIGTITATAYEGYNFVGWSFENRDKLDDKSCGTENPTDKYTLYVETVVYMGHFTADINFHNISGHDLSTVTRRYEQNLFSDAGTYTYPYYVLKENNTNITHAYAASPTDEEMINGEYVFLGWVDGDGLVNDDGTLTAEGSYVWDEYAETQQFITSNTNAAEPYILDDDTLVYSTMELYPVYAKCEINYTTNFALAEVDETDTYNVPDIPKETSRNLNNADNTYTISFTVDNSTTVLKNDESAGYYTVISVELIDNIAEESMVLNAEADGSYIASGLKLGGSYTVVANYMPMVIIYHKGGNSGDELQYSKCSPNSLLGKSPMPINTADRVGDGYVLLGWTLSAPSTNEPFHRVDSADALPLVNETTMVTHPMELWPVYVKTVAVNSTIDNFLSNPKDTRSLTIPNINIASGTLIAQENVIVSNDSYYVFVGWCKNNNTEDLITNNNSLIISSTDIYAPDITYTAVYEKAYRITYHGDDTNEVVYTVMVPQSEQRSFVKTTEIPDENGNLTTVTVPIDSDAFSNVEDYLENNQVFSEWQNINSSGIQNWDEFCNETITQNMDLYPIAFTVIVESEDQNLETLYRDSDSTEPIDQSKLEVKVGLDTVNQQDDEKISSVSLLIMSEYKQEKLNVSVLKNAYSPSNVGSTPESEIPITLNLRKTADLNLSDSESSWLYEKKSTDNEGKAIFVLAGSLKIEKIVSNSEGTENDDTFILKITVGDQQQLLPIEAGKTITVSKIPYGQQWTVEEDMDWAWGYKNGSFMSNGQITSYCNTASVTFTNEKLQTSLLSGTAYTHNVFGVGTSNDRDVSE